MRPRSRSSICAKTCLLLRESSRNSSRSQSLPVAMIPPSAKLNGGSGTIVFSMRLRKSASSSSASCRDLKRSVARCDNAFLIAGILARDAASASTSRGLAVSRVTRLKSLSRSSTPSRARRNSSRAIVSRTPISTASRRALISARSSDGRSNHARNRRLPMGVTAQSMERNSVRPASVPAKSGAINSRFRTVTTSSTRQFWRSYQPMRST